MKLKLFLCILFLINLILNIEVFPQCIDLFSPNTIVQKDNDNIIEYENSRFEISPKASIFIGQTIESIGIRNILRKGEFVYVNSNMQITDLKVLAKMALSFDGEVYRVHVIRRNELYIENNEGKIEVNNGSVLILEKDTRMVSSATNGLFAFDMRQQEYSFSSENLDVQRAFELNQAILVGNKEAIKKAKVFYFFEYESVGGNAGSAREAHNMYIDKRTSLIKAVGNYQHIPKKILSDPNFMEITILVKIDMSAFKGIIGELNLVIEENPGGNLSLISMVDHFSSFKIVEILYPSILTQEVKSSLDALIGISFRQPQQ
ncbi:MAG: hypothetical protein ABIA04_01180 [Pseudomonadota bacterium]